ncbi:MAG: low-specificity L-threonine aldolase [Myxococcales bacterium]|nr:low-specificity L-threonine aldolase [Myxococcales bacterium]
MPVTGDAFSPPLAAIDLRSDTVTRPTAAMREAMARAEVGDDVFGDDPTVNALQEAAAARLGKEAALYVPSGTAANQIALLTHCRPGDDVLIGDGAHQMCLESGGGGALAGVQYSVIGKGGFFTAAEVVAAIKPDNAHYPPTRLCSVENTHNSSGGRVWQGDQVRAIAEVARARGIALHLDGARLFNAEVASGIPAAQIAAPFDTISFCLSKGLGAPVGSLLVGSRDTLVRAHRYRKMLGGGMRQAGIIAAAGLYALTHHIGRLAEDHENARRFAVAVAGAPHVLIDPATVETNIVLLELAASAPLDAEELVRRARERGLLLVTMGRRRVRAVTHLDVDRDACERAAAILVELLRAA